MRMSIGWVFNYDGMASALETRSDWILHRIVIESAPEGDRIGQFFILSSLLHDLIFKQLDLVHKISLLLITLIKLVLKLSHYLNLPLLVFFLDPLIVIIVLL
jgi:hypothetical protein